MTSTATEPAVYATDDEIEAAIGGLSPAELRRLARFADLRAGGLRRLSVRDREGRDLLQEAVARTVAGTRKWKKGITFVKHLIEAIRSISNHAPEEFKGARLVADLESPVMLHVECSAPDPERDMAAHEELVRVRDVFKEDKLMNELIDGLADGMTGPDLRVVLNLSETKLESLFRRLRRTVRKEVRP